MTLLVMQVWSTVLNARSSIALCLCVRPQLPCDSNFRTLHCEASAAACQESRRKTCLVMQLPTPCYLAATSAHAVQVAACPSTQHYGRSKLRRIVLHHTASQAGSRSQQHVTKALQTEEKPTAQKKRGRKKGTHLELPSVSDTA